MAVQPIHASLDDLTPFDIDAARGFLPSHDPLRALPACFAPWEEVAGALPKLLLSGGLRRRIETLPLLSAEALDDPRALRRAMMVLSFLGHAYVWCDESAATRLPESIAVPWCDVAARLGRPPVLSYASYALDNWARIDSAGPVAIDNLTILQNFLGGADEDWFILIHVDIEARAAGAIGAIPAAINTAATEDGRALAAALTDIGASLAAMTETLRRMPEYCDPYIYYHRVRPFIHGWKNNPSVPDGIIYEGVDAFAGMPQCFRGETGAQSGIVPAIDAALGIAHQRDELRVYLSEMREYMPSGHRAFVEAVERSSRVRGFVLGAGAGLRTLVTAYDACVEQVEEFRSIHLEYAARYIFSQAQSGDLNPTGVGTGGTPFMPYLKKHRDETRSAKLYGGGPDGADMVA